MKFLYLLKKRPIIIGLVTAIMFQLVFNIIWMTAYRDVNNNITHFTIAVVNNDSQQGNVITKKLKNSLSFQLKEMNNEKALTLLKQRKISLIITIPKTFTNDLSNPTKKAQIFYTLNASTSTMEKSVMKTIVPTITDSLNKQAVEQGIQLSFSKMNVPDTVSTSLSQNLSQRVEATTKELHSFSNFALQMTPMMVLLSSFVGSMLLSMNMHQVKSIFQQEQQINKWQFWLLQQSLNIFSSILVSLVGVGLMSSLGGNVEQGFLSIWLFHGFVFFVFLQLTQFSFYLFGETGAWANIWLFSLQLITSGSIIPTTLMNDFYVSISHYLPATYVVNGIMYFQMGGEGIKDTYLSLVYILIVLVIISALLIFLKKDKLILSTNKGEK